VTNTIVGLHELDGLFPGHSPNLTGLASEEDTEVSVRPGQQLRSEGGGDELGGDGLGADHGGNGRPAGCKLKLVKECLKQLFYIFFVLFPK
jgi:hypothetical protein